MQKCIKCGCFMYEFSNRASILPRNARGSIGGIKKKDHNVRTYGATEMLQITSIHSIVIVLVVSLPDSKCKLIIDGERENVINCLDTERFRNERIRNTCTNMWLKSPQTRCGHSLNIQLKYRSISMHTYMHVCIFR